MYLMRPGYLEIFACMYLLEDVEANGLPIVLLNWYTPWCSILRIFVGS